SNVSAPGVIQTPNGIFPAGFGATVNGSTNPNVSATVSYSPALPSSKSIDVTIAAAPTLSNVALTTPTTLSEGNVATITGSMQNVGTNDTLTLVIDWGDNLGGSPATLSFPGTQTSFTVTHTYLDNVPAGAISNFNINVI